MLEPARTVIEKCGGPRAVAAITGRNIATVYRWGHPREKRGCGGLIPADIQQVLIAHARRTQGGLRPEDFFPEFEDSPEIERNAA